MGPHGAEVTPRQTSVGQPVTLTAELSGTPIVGTPRFSWDLDGDGQCETAWTTSASIVTVFSTVGVKEISNCAQDDDGAGVWTCHATVPVYPPGRIPRLTVRRSSSAYYASLGQVLRGGTELKLHWNRAVTVRYSVQLFLNTRGNSETETYRVPARIRDAGGTLALGKVKHANGLLRLHKIAQKWAIKHEPDTLYGSQLYVKPNFSRDPLFAPLQEDLELADDWFGPAL